MYDLIIIGAGPAGITAAIYAARKRMHFLVIGKEVGGQVAKSSVVENYTGYQEISGESLAKQFEEHMKEFEFDFKQEMVERIEKTDLGFKVFTKSGEFESKTLIAATGSEPRKLKVNGEEEFRNKGITYCATCDAPLFPGKDVVVVGGGNSGLEAALQLTKIANKIFLIEINDSLAGDKILAQKVVEHEKVEVLYNTKVIEILGDAFVNKVKVEVASKKRELNVEGVFINIGYVPSTGIFKDLVNMNEYGEIEIAPDTSTNIEGFFGAGDCTNVSYKQIGIAVGEGSKAAISAFNYLAVS